MTSNNSLPTDWFERKLIPEGYVSKPGDVTETLGEHCTALAFALLGTSDSSATKVLQVYKSTRGSLLNFLGCSLDPPTFASAIKCHQKSTSNSAGSSVGSLAPPRATPRLGGVYVSCQYFPCSFVLALRELGLRLGVKAQLPLRASSRGVLPGAPNALSVFISNLSSWLTKAAALRASKTRLGLSYCFAACGESLKAAPVANQVTGVTE